MNEFDTLCEKYAPNTITQSKREMKPRKDFISDLLADSLADEYRKQYVKGNRNFHSNFLKALKFEVNGIRDRCQNDPEFLADYIDDMMDSAEVVDEVGLEGLPEEI